MRLSVLQLKSLIKQTINEARFKPNDGEFPFEINEFDFDDNREGADSLVPRVVTLSGTFQVENGHVVGYNIEDVLEFSEDGEEQLDPQEFEDSLSTRDSRTLRNQIMQVAREMIRNFELDAGESTGEMLNWR